MARILVLRSPYLLSDFGNNSQLLLQFPAQGCLEIFSSFGLAPRKLPLAGESIQCRSLANQDLIFMKQQSRHHSFLYIHISITAQTIF